MRVSNFFMLTALSFFLHVSASPAKTTKTAKPDNDFNFPQLPTMDSLSSIAFGKAVQIPGYQCRQNFYSNSFLKRAAILGASQLKDTKFQLYPMKLKPGYYIYPIFQNENLLWAQGQPEGFDRVVFDSDGNMLYAATARSHPGFTVDSAYRSCSKANKILLPPSGESTIFTSFGSPGKSPWDQLNPSSPAPAFNSHLDNHARNHPINFEG